MGRNLFSREPLALAVNDNDAEWFDIVNSIVQLMFLAENNDLTQAKALEQVNSIGLDDGLKGRMVHIVSQFGNYAELYKKYLETLVPRTGLNLLYKEEVDNTGLLYYLPFGILMADGQSPLPGQTLERVISRGHLVCGVIPRAGFADYNSTTGTWSGFDIEFCKALNAAAHIGVTDTVTYVNVSRDESIAYAFLQNKTVDVIAGDTVTLEKDLLKNITFSAPYFYDSEGGARAIASRPDDSQWSDFVYWILMATIYAEDEGITRESARNMPAVFLFGESLKPMFFDVISAVGSYREIYGRTLASIIPRSGRNQLNKNLTGPQQFPIPIT